MSGQLAVAFVRIRANTDLLKADIAKGVREGAEAGGAETGAASAGSKAGKRSGPSPARARVPRAADPADADHDQPS